MTQMNSIFNTKQPRMYIRGSAARRGFSFAEVMFAVVILGIGFIMVAAVFPVAIQQTQATGEENIGAALARQAADSIGQLMAHSTIPNPLYNPNALSTDPPSWKVQNETLFPPTVKNYVLGTAANAVPPAAIVVPFVGTRWDLVKSNVILPTDARYAYVMFYKRDNGSSAAQLIVVAVAARNHPTYTPSNDLLNYPDSYPNTLQANTNASITISASGDFPAAAPQTIICPDTVTGISTTTVTPAEGYYLQIPQTMTVPPPGAPLGRSYTLGRLASTGVWELMPGDSMALTAGSDGRWGTAGRIADSACSAQVANMNAPATLQPTVAYAQLFTTPDAPQGRIIINSGSMHSGFVPASAVQGAYVIIADDFPPLPTMQTGSVQDYSLEPNIPGSYTVGAMNGHIFRLGAPVPTSLAVQPGTFNLDPAYPMRPIPPGGATTFSPDAIPNPAMLAAATANGSPNAGLLGPYGSAKVYIIGAGKTDPTAGPNSPVSGPAQDIGVFSTYFQVQ